ncbi:MAG: FAD binding domain-containing protein [Planctomycetes bacterium]|nr:FAD binding domain-containing protein [Planctomycetota bacterium]
MKSFKYTEAQSESVACGLLSESSLPLAGGTNLLNLMKEYVVQPDALVDIKNIPGTHSIDEVDGGLRVGANVTLTELIESRVVASGYPVLHQALVNTATPQIRNRGTLGGNLCARPACWYFSHEGFECAKRGDSGCSTKDGENEFHAIFGTDSLCVAVHPSSAAPALMALGATLRIVAPSGPRVVEIDQFFSSEDVRKENVLAANEIITHVVVGSPNANSATYEVRQKATHDWPISLASVALDLKFGVCQSARVVLGAVALSPVRAGGAEDRLVGNRITESVAEAAAEAAVQGAKPLSQNAYKVQATRAAVKRAILIAATGSWK